MVYRVSVRRNPRILALFALIPALPAAGVGATVWLDRTLGIIGTAIAVYLSYHLSKFLAAHLGSYVETNDQGLRCRTTAKEQVALDWAAVTLAGECFPHHGPAYLFAYSESDDRLLAVPQDYSDYETLREELRSRCGAERFRELVLAPEETLRDRLRAMLER